MPADYGRKEFKVPGFLDMYSLESVEQYIKDLEWSEEATDWEKTLVAANIREFARFLRERIAGSPVGCATCRWGGKMIGDVRCTGCDTVINWIPK